MAQWQLLTSAEEVALEAARQIRTAATEAIARNGSFNLVLAGGSTPLETYRLLAEDSADLDPWHLYYGDERCLPIGDPDRNSQMVDDTGLTKRVGAHYPIPAELGPEQGAQRYSELLEGSRPFDMVILGMGEDGHTASLFPDHVWPEGEAAIAVTDSPKPPSERISLSLDALQHCRRMLVMVTGEGKREAVRDWRNGGKLPVALVSDIEQAIVLAPASLVE